jgi:S-adenosylmethionine uptake transporter
MSAPLLMLLASLLFALMAVCVKWASADYGAGEIVLYRSLIGLALMATVLRGRGTTLKTPVPAMHFWRSLAGTSALCLWFYSLGELPLGTAMTLNYMSSVWIACFLLGASVLAGPGSAARIDGRLFAAVLAGFAGVALVLRPTIAQDQLWHGLCGLLGGMRAAMAYLQVTALGRRGEPDTRIVVYFALGGVLTGAASMLWTGFSRHSLAGAGLLLAVGLLATVAQLIGFSSVEDRGQEGVELAFEARSFLHRQVRSMTGTLAEVGMGRMLVRDMAEALAAKDRARCGPVAPAEGLYLVRVDYPAK